MSLYLEDLAPCDDIEAAGRTDLHVWERAVIDTGAALRIAADCLHRSAADLTASEPVSEPAPSPCASPGRCRDRADGGPGPAAHAHRARPGRARAGTFRMGAGGDVAARHACDRERDRGVVSAARALHRVAGGPGHAAYFPAPGRSAASSCPPGRNWPARASGCELPVPRCVRRLTPTRYGRWMRSCCTPSRPPSRRHGSLWARPRNRSPSCATGSAVSASRLRAAVHRGPDRVSWSPDVTSGGWQWMAQAAAVTSHLSELALRSLATRAGQPPQLAGDRSAAAWRG